MPSLVNSYLGPMSSLTWGAAASRVAGVIAGARAPDDNLAAIDAITETLQDFDTRHDWKFTQVVADDIDIAAGDSTFDLPSHFKKPYAAYLRVARRSLSYIERGNWHRMFPGDTSTSIPDFYSLYDDASTGKGMLMPQSTADTLVVLYYRPITYTNGRDDVLDIPARWEGYILAGAKALLVGNKIANEKAMFWDRKYEKGIIEARKDDRRVPDQFLTFTSPDGMNIPPWMNPLSTWEAIQNV